MPSIPDDPIFYVVVKHHQKAQMKINTILIKNHTVGWDFQEIHLKNLNLFVGESASGKSLMLSTIFFIANKVVNDQSNIGALWRMQFEHAGDTYDWEFDSKLRENLPSVITKEKLIRFDKDGLQTVLVERTQDKFEFKGVTTPRMAAQSSCIYLLREDPDIQPIYEGFQRILLRNFVGAELDHSLAVQSITKQTISAISQDKSMDKLFRLQLNVSARLMILKEYYKDRYKAVLDMYRDVFPFVEQFEFKDMSESGGILSSSLPGKIPNLHIKDRNSGTLVQVQQLSSGMKKVLLIMTDVMTLPRGMIYLIDEYENSLGLNAINFLPTLIAEHGGDNQFIVTSHHPYLINAIPVKNWIVFHRNGFKVSMKQGDELAESYGKSKQQSFIKLINDPFFTEGAS
jgi:AAA15 family ATPase/GTPase